jgi:hypothetical protein
MMTTEEITRIEEWLRAWKAQRKYLREELAFVDMMVAELSTLLESARRKKRA